MQKAAGKLTTKQPRSADQERRCRIGPPRVVGPEILDTSTVDRHLIKTERGDIEDVIQVAGVAHAQVDEQVVHQHHQQHAIDDAQDVDARGLLFQVGHRRPQRHWHLHRPLALHPQVQALRLVGLQVQLEQVIVLRHRTTGERQQVAGALRQLEAALTIRQVQIEVIQWRVGHLQQPWLLTLQGLRAIVQVQTQPEHRTRVAGIEHRTVMPTEAVRQDRRGDLGNVGVATHILEHLQLSAQGQLTGELIKIDCGRQRGRETEEPEQNRTHKAPRTNGNNIRRSRITPRTIDGQKPAL